MNIKQIKNGASFSARIEGRLVKGHVFVYPSKTKVFLCQNTKTGNQSPNLLGYKSSWQVSTEKGIVEWSFEVNEGEVKFGCGAVTLPLETIQNFVAVKALSFTPKQIEDYFKVMDILSKRKVTLSATDWKVLNANFK